MNAKCEKFLMKRRKIFSGKVFAKIYETVYNFLLFSLDVPDGVRLSTFWNISLLTYDLLTTRSARRRATLRPSLIKLNFVDGPHRSFYIFHSHKAFMKR